MNELMKCIICGKQFTSHGMQSHSWRAHGEGQNFKPFKGKQAWNKGLTKENDERVQQYGEQLRHKSNPLEIELNDDGKLYERYLAKKSNDRYHEKRGFDLTFEEYCQLVKEAGIKSSQLGIHGYVLARYNDEGRYAVGNCRFITQLDNLKERKVSDKMRENGRSSGLRVSQMMKIQWQLHRKERLAAIQKGVRTRFGHSSQPKPVDPRYSGPNNSQYQKFWITDGQLNKKWHETWGELPEGFYKGRVCNWKNTGHSNIK